MEQNMPVKERTTMLMLIIWPITLNPLVLQLMLLE
jgi:hypothetical protein